MSALSPARTWGQVLSPLIDAAMREGPGTVAERRALAMVGLANSWAHLIQRMEFRMGALLNEIQVSGAYATLRYDDEWQLADAEPYGRLGRTQLWKYKSSARHVTPDDLDAALLEAPLSDAPLLGDVDPERARIDLRERDAVRIGIEKVHMLTSQWEGSAPEQRRAMIEAIDQPTREFARVAYKRGDRPYLLIDDDRIYLWRDDVGTPVARILTDDPRDLSLLQSLLGRGPRRAMAA